MPPTAEADRGRPRGPHRRIPGDDLAIPRRPGQGRPLDGRRGAASMPAAGGRYRVEVLPGDVVLGEFVELDPPRRLVHTWGWESASGSVPPGSTTVAFDLVPRGDGTLVRVTHTGLPQGVADGPACPRLGPLPPATGGGRRRRRSRGRSLDRSGPSCDPVSRKESGMPKTRRDPQPRVHLHRGPGRAAIRQLLRALSRRARATRSTSARTRRSSSGGRRSRCRPRAARTSRARRPRRRASSSGGAPATPRHCTSRRWRTASRSSPSRSTGRSGGPLRWRIPTAIGSPCTRRISRCSGRRGEHNGREQDCQPAHLGRPRRVRRVERGRVRDAARDGVRVGAGGRVRGAPRLAAPRAERRGPRRTAARRSDRRRSRRARWSASPSRPPSQPTPTAPGPYCAQISSGTIAVCSSSNGRRLVAVGREPDLDLGDRRVGRRSRRSTHVTCSRFGRSQARISPPALPSNW